MNKTIILTWAVILLVIFNMTTIATIIYNNYSESYDKETIVLNNAGSELLNGRFFRQTIGFDNSQMETFRKINREFRPNANGIIFQIDSLKNEMFLELNKSNADTLKLNKLSLETGALHAELKMETNRFFLKIKTICKPQQIELLQTAFTPLFRNVNCSGKGNGHQGKGEGYGNGFRNQNTNK